MFQAHSVPTAKVDRCQPDLLFDRTVWFRLRRSTLWTPPAHHDLSHSLRWIAANRPRLPVILANLHHLVWTDPPCGAARNRVDRFQRDHKHICLLTEKGGFVCDDPPCDPIKSITNPKRTTIGAHQPNQTTHPPTHPPTPTQPTHHPLYVHSHVYEYLYMYVYAYVYVYVYVYAYKFV